MLPKIESCCKRLSNVPRLARHTLMEPHICRKPSLAICVAETMTMLCFLHALEKMLDFSSVCCSFGLQSFKFFVKRTGSNSGNYCFKQGCGPVRGSA